MTTIPKGTNIVASHRGAWIEIKYGLSKSSSFISSRPTGARGLKYISSNRFNFHFIFWSRPTGARGLKSTNAKEKKFMLIQSRPTGARGLKSWQYVITKFSIILSRPTGARGLKFQIQLPNQMFYCIVASHRGAWIEIHLTLLKVLLELVCRVP